IYKATDDDPTVDALYDLYMDGVGKEELEFFSASEIRKMGLKRFMALATDADLSGVEQLPTAGKSDTSSDASGSDNDYDSLFGSDKAECLFIDAAKSVSGGDTLVTGDIFLFGDEYRYRNPDGNTLEWDVLALNEYGALLLTHYVIDCIPYEEFRHSTTWEESSLRTWMNGSFIQRYFSEAQRDAILRVRLQNPNNPKYGTYGGHNTTDRVFALSYAEGEQYLTRDTINTTATEYARSKGAKLRHENKNKTVYWWLRTPGNIQQRAMITSLKNNTLDYEGNGVGTYFDDGLRNNTGVRPALWLSWAYIKDHPECVVKKPVVVIGTLIKNSVGLRKTPGKNAEKLDILNRGTEVTVIGKTWVSGELWYCVEVNGMTGYLNSSMLEVLDGDVVPEM
ncbi:MAG: SH3 domain-containing protein, partial [Clostridia bacterium]|nr:SH3 domain-containing protein [Clostridia bacterium]